MSRDGIVCLFNMFDMYQIVNEIKNGQIMPIGLMTLEELGKNIGTYCLTQNINYVHLYGDMVYSKKIIEDIDKYTNNLYSEKKLEIEVN